VALKGSVLANTVYPRPDLRPLADVDLLVDPVHFERALVALESAGGRLRTRNWEAMLRLRSSEVTVVMPAGTHVDLHWHVVNRAALRASFRLDPGELLAPAVPGPVPTVAAPDPAAHLGYVAWHMTVSGGVRLLWACDVELCAREVLPRAEDLVRWCTRTRTLLATAVALDYARLLFPDGAASVLSRLVPGSVWRRLNAGARRPVVGRSNGRWSGAFLPLATRTTTWDSARALRPPFAGLVGSLGPDRRTLDIMTEDVGGPQGRVRYLAAVREWAV
jgi:hypothetical protein